MQSQVETAFFRLPETAKAQNPGRSCAFAVGAIGRPVKLLHGVDADLFLAALNHFEFDFAIDQGEQRVIGTDADTVTGKYGSSSLTDQDVAGLHDLTVALLGAQALGLAVTAVLGGTHTFFMSKEL